MSELSVAVIGCGRMGAETPPHVRKELPLGWWPLNHMDAVRGVEGLRLAAVCDSDHVAAQRAADRGGVPAFADSNELLEAVHPDIVTVATRTEGRCALLSAAAHAGVRAIHAEKPLSRSLAEGEKAAADLTAQRVAFTWGATRRHMAAYRNAKAAIDHYELGPVRQVLLKFGCGALMWTHPHSVDIAAFFADDSEITGARACFMAPHQVVGATLDADPRLTFGQIEFANGVTALITAAEGSDVVIGCERGEVSVPSDGASVEVRRMQGAYCRERISLEPTPAESGLQRALIGLRDALHSGAHPPFDISRALAFQRALFALALSGCSGGVRVAPSDVPPDFVVTGRQGNLFA